MTDAIELARRLDNMARHQQENLSGTGRFNNFLNGNLAHEAAAFIRDMAAAQPEYLSGCLHPGNEPNSCQYEGKCLSMSCNHNGKTWYGPRMTLLAQDPNVLYPKETT